VVAADGAAPARDFSRLHTGNRFPDGKCADEPMVRRQYLAGVIQGHAVDARDGFGPDRTAHVLEQGSIGDIELFVGPDRNPARDADRRMVYELDTRSILPWFAVYLTAFVSRLRTIC